MFARALIAIALVAACGSTPPSKPYTPPAVPAAEVIVVGTLGRGHLASRDYSVAVLKDIIRAVDPDLVLVELPPDRLRIALSEYRDRGAVSEPRVARFPEYTEALFPLLAELDAPLVGFDPWSEAIAGQRAIAERALRAERPAEATRIDTAIADAESRLEAEGLADDPLGIHGDPYDEITGVGMALYDELWGESLGDAGWGAGNRERLARIDEALANRSQGVRRVLIMTGAWKKGALRAGLSERSDVALIDLVALWPRARSPM